MVVDLRVEIALHDILLVAVGGVPSVGDLHPTDKRKLPRVPFLLHTTQFTYVANNAVVFGCARSSSLSECAHQLCASKLWLLPILKRLSVKVSILVPCSELGYGPRYMGLFNVSPLRLTVFALVESLLLLSSVSSLCKASPPVGNSL